MDDVTRIESALARVSVASSTRDCGDDDESRHKGWAYSTRTSIRTRLSMVNWPAEAIAAQADATTLPTIVLGDFNTLSRQKCVETREFLEARGYTTPFPTGTATWRTVGLKIHADWIFVLGGYD